MPHKFSLLLIPLLGACASTSATTPAANPAASGTKTESRSVSGPQPRQVPDINVRPQVLPPQIPLPPPTAGEFRPPRVMSLPGAEGVIGANAASLTQQFGLPRLDVREGDVRKLQFSGTSCVLDVYLYPKSPNAEPTATYVDARRSSDGLDVDRVSCIQTLRGQ